MWVVGICVLSFVYILSINHGSSSDMAIETSLLISKWTVHIVVMNFVHVLCGVRVMKWTHIIETIRA